jgi:hypothetical protein
MPIVILDPGLLAYLPDISRTALFAKVELLNTWSKFVGTQRSVDISLPPSVFEVLTNNNLMPAHEPAKEVIEKTGLRHVYSPEDLIRPVYHLLEKALQGAYCCLSDELHEEFESDPAQPWHGTNANVEAMSQRALMMSLIENRIHEDTRFRFFASALNTQKVRFGARVDAIDPAADSVLGDMGLPQRFEDEFQHVRSIEDLFAGLDPNDLWAEAVSSADIKFAIRLGCRKRMISEGNYTNLNGIPAFFVGPDFFPSLRFWQADGRNRFASQTLECCAAAVLDLPVIEIKAFHKAKRGADLALPLRAHISKSGVALRLMMWQRPGPTRTIEFANVGGKQEEEIIYSDPSAAV